MTLRFDPISIPAIRRHALAALGIVVAAGLSPGAVADDGGGGGPGAEIYRRLCASCHGKSGEGVRGEYSRPLTGDKSVRQLARYIEKWMPDEEPEKCVGEDAEQVARHVHDAFYSPIARARNRPPRLQLSRLTVRQYRNAAADVVGSFRAPMQRGNQRGLRAEYFNSRRPGGRPVVNRLEPRVDFDRARDPAGGRLDAEGFSARWQGSVLAPGTGDYEFTIRTDHAARLWLNDARKPLIDAWVKSGDTTEYGAPVFLLGGRAYPLRLEFTSRTQGVEKKGKEAEPAQASVELHWKPPGGVREVVPQRHLSPEIGPEIFVATTPFPPDDRSVGYERGTSISRAWDDTTTTAAIEAASYVSSHLEELAGLRKVGADHESELRDFCRRLVERAFRRPLTEKQRQLYIDRQFAGAPDLEAAVRRVVILTFKSPRFLYLDPGDERPDAYTVASRLSFALWDSLPDRELLEAAAAGRLASREQVVRQAERMIPDVRTRSKVSQFLERWLDLEPVTDLGRDKEDSLAFDQALAADLRTSLDLFLDEVIWGGRADFRQLLLSSDLYVNGRLSQYYGFDLPADAPFQKIRAKQPERAGILTHPYLMARFAYRDASSPIHRGVFIVRSVLGRSLRPPPEAVTPFTPDLHPDLTTRERVSLQTAPKTCQTCHGMINTLGFTLEHFDAVGRYREREMGKPIDASGSYELPSGQQRTFDGARELAKFLAGSEDVHRAFVLQLFHHLVKQPVLAHGVETPEELRQVFTRNDFNVRKLLVQIATTSALAGGTETDGREESVLDRPDPDAYNHRRRNTVRRRRF